MRFLSQIQTTDNVQIESELTNNNDNTAEFLSENDFIYYENTERFTCDICNTTFNQFNKLSKHITVKHMKTCKKSKKNYAKKKCTECHRNFNSLAALKVCTK